MDGPRFDAWTRRRFGMAAGGAATAAALGLLGLADADAKNKNKNKKTCKKLGQSCDQSRKKKKCCNDNELCAQVKGKSGNICCKQNGQGCKNTGDCCGNDTCGNNGKCQLSNT